MGIQSVGLLSFDSPHMLCPTCRKQNRNIPRAGRSVVGCTPSRRSERLCAKLGYSPVRRRIPKPTSIQVASTGSICDYGPAAFRGLRWNKWTLVHEGRSDKCAATLAMGHLRVGLLMVS